MTIEEFVGSLTKDQPPDLSPPLVAVWHGLRGEWDPAHSIVQASGSPEAAWVHAWLHRIEGDLANAGYWYRRARRPEGDGDTAVEGRTIAAALLAE